MQTTNHTPQLSFDELFLDAGRDQRYLVAGVDEAGRGPLAGSVVAAAVILDPDRKIQGLADSKALTEERREALADEIRERAVCWHVAEATVEEIDKLNILHASMLAMTRAIEGLSEAPNHCLIDGNRCPITRFNCQAIVKGDALVQEISAASILAKVTRDHQMHQMHEQYPQYGFDRHKGYPTRLHMEALQRHGPLDIHRRSFAPVRKVMLPIGEPA
jgi:ribonuclease HII